MWAGEGGGRKATKGPKVQWSPFFCNKREKLFQKTTVRQQKMKMRVSWMQWKHVERKSSDVEKHFHRLLHLSSSLVGSWKGKLMGKLNLSMSLISFPSSFFFPYWIHFRRSQRNLFSHTKRLRHRRWFFLFLLFRNVMSTTSYFSVGDRPEDSFRLD